MQTCLYKYILQKSAYAHLDDGKTTKALYEKAVLICRVWESQIGKKGACISHFLSPCKKHTYIHMYLNRSSFFNNLNFSLRL